MRDLLIITIVLGGSIAALRRPWIGVLVWTWLSLMNPHRFAYGMSYDAPLSAIAAATTLSGLLMTKDRSSPMIDVPVFWFVVFSAWITVSWLFGMSPEGDYPQWNKVMKINLMVLVALALIRSRLQIMGLAWVVTASIALLGIKGGIFTFKNGGNFKVWGPPGSFIEDNNEFALALIITVPLLRFLQLQVCSKWLKAGLLVNMVLCMAAALGSHSRGALLASGAMAGFFWWKGKNKLGVGLLLLLVGTALVAFMPDAWTQRMNTIENYEVDDSAMGRISAWWTAWNLALHYPSGVGFNPARSDLFELYSPYKVGVHAAHSIYFQVLGNHGFVGLAMFLAIWLTSWRTANWLLTEAPKYSQAGWCVDLANMSQVALIAYLTGGAFLSLAYFDQPYNIMVLLLTARLWVQQQAWKTEPGTTSRWTSLLGLTPMPRQAVAA